MNMHASVEVPAPFKAEELAKFAAEVPRDALISITTFTVGQRDPEPSRYILIARWSKE